MGHSLEPFECRSLLVLLVLRHSSPIPRSSQALSIKRCRVCFILHDKSLPSLIIRYRISLRVKNRVFSFRLPPHFKLSFPSGGAAKLSARTKRAGSHQKVSPTIIVCGVLVQFTCSTQWRNLILFSFESLFIFLGEGLAVSFWGFFDRFHPGFSQNFTNGYFSSKSGRRSRR